MEFSRNPTERFKTPPCRVHGHQDVSVKVSLELSVYLQRRLKPRYKEGLLCVQAPEHEVGSGRPVGTTCPAAYTPSNTALEQLLSCAQVPTCTGLGLLRAPEHTTRPPRSLSVCLRVRQLWRLSSRYAGSSGTTVLAFSRVRDRAWCQPCLCPLPRHPFLVKLQEALPCPQR